MSDLNRETADLTATLVAIESVNPRLDESGSGEAEIAEFVAAWCRAEGLAAHLVDHGDGRQSVVAEYRSSAAGAPTLVLCGHLDTVGLGSMTAPLTPRIDGDRLYGRGSYDMKAGLAAILIACREAARQELAVSVVVLAVADEEHGSLGIRETLDHLGPEFHADAAIVTEPTELAIGLAHKGFQWTEIEIVGRAAHGSRPQLGIDAIVKAGPLLVRLAALGERLATRTHPLLGPATVHASLITGGQEPSTIPERCTLTIERRTLPGETSADVEAEIEEILAACRAADPEFSASARTLLTQPAMETDAASAIVTALADAAAAVTGAAADTVGLSYWADSAVIAARGIPTVLFGAAGEGAHADTEWVSLESAGALTRILVAAERRLAGDVILNYTA